MNKLTEFLLEGNIAEAVILAEKMNEESLFSNLVEFAFENEENIIWYTLLNELLLNYQTPSFHYVAAEIFSIALNHNSGSYDIALFHIRKAAELSQYKEVKYLVPFILLNELPEKIVSDTEAKKIAEMILKIDETQSEAKNFLERYK